ncbi:MAG: sigma-54 dependent transcriptional regulator [Vicinamibacteria bacterium]|nr:sigma-54 dependent transcriptional regulator [Vicinamibacteria bacterium]
MILIVDDDPSVTASLSLLLKQAGHASTSSASPEEALHALAERPIALVLQDMNFSRRTSGEEGLALLARIRELRPGLPVILMTAWGSIPLAVEGIKRGASDFVTKPWTREQLLLSIRTALGLAQAGGSAAASDLPSREDLDASWDFGPLVGEDPGLLRVLEIAGRVAATDASVLVTGESGTGKELVAEAIHRNSARRAGPFVKVNLGGIAATLFESEMFGHVRGAFTDARQDRKGRFELADGGTIFLDEIGELDAGSQVKLLRVLQDRTYEVLGSSVTRSVDVRVISATNRDLAEQVEKGAFREDLLYRVNLIVLRLPPLRARPADIALLARHFLRRLGQTYGRDELQLTPRAVSWLQSLPWPGNVRQLGQALERTVLMTPRPALDVEDFAAATALDARARERDPLPAVGAMTLDEIESGMVRKALRHHAGNLTRAAESLGLSRAALYRRLEKYGLDS